MAMDGTWHGMVCIFIENDFFLFFSFLLCSPHMPAPDAYSVLFCSIKNNMCDVCRDALGWAISVFLFSNGVCSIYLRTQLHLTAHSPWSTLCIMSVHRPTCTTPHTSATLRWSKETKNKKEQRPILLGVARGWKRKRQQPHGHP